MLTLIAVAVSIVSLEPSTPLAAATRCRTLSQQACHEFLLISAHIDETKNRANLSTSITTFEFALSSLTDSLPTISLPDSDRFAHQVAEIRSAWDDIKPAFSAAAAGKAPTTTDLNIAASSNTYIYFRLDGICSKLDKSASTPPSILARQDALGERMASEVLFISLNINAPQFRRRLDLSIESFDQLFASLSTTDSAAERAFTAAQAQFQSLQPILKSATNPSWQSSTTDLTMVTTSLAALRQSMTELTIAVKANDKATTFTSVPDGN